MNRIFKKIIFKTKFFFIKKLDGLNNTKFTKKYCKLLRKHGMNIIGNPDYIASNVYFDGTGYNLIELNEGCVISRNVSFLTHDFSMRTAFIAAQYDYEQVKNMHINKKITIKENVFIGINVIILPGTVIEKNCIIGAGSVVKGHIEENSVLIGNPAKEICKISEIFKKYEYLLKQENKPIF